MDNVLIVVDDLEAVKAFFIELGLKLEGETTVEGPSVGTLIGLKDVRATLAMMRTPDGQGIELDKIHTSPMPQSKSHKKKRQPKRVLALPDLEHAKAAVLNSLTSVSGQRTFAPLDRLECQTEQNSARRSPQPMLASHDRAVRAASKESGDRARSVASCTKPPTPDS